MDISIDDVFWVVSASKIKFVSEDVDVLRKDFFQCDGILPAHSAQRLGIEPQFVFRFDADEMNIVGQFADGRKFDYSTPWLGFGEPGAPPSHLQCRSEPNHHIAYVLYFALYREWALRENLVPENGPADRVRCELSQLEDTNGLGAGRLSD